MPSAQDTNLFAPLPDATPPETKNKRWLTRLEKNHPLFWSSLLSFEQLQLKYQSSFLSLVTPLPLSTGFIEDAGRLIIPRPSFSLDLNHVETVFAPDELPGTHASLECDFTHRHCQLQLSSTNPFSEQALSHFAGSFACEMELETTALDIRRKLKEFPLCPACAHAAELSIKQAVRNPLCAILNEHRISRAPLAISLVNPGFRFLASHQPESLALHDGWVISLGRGQSLRVDLRQVYSFVGRESLIDGLPHFELQVFNSHRHPIVRLAAPSELVSESWRGILTNSGSGIPPRFIELPRERT